MLCPKCYGRGQVLQKSVVEYPECTVEYEVPVPCEECQSRGVTYCCEGACKDD